MKIGTETLHNAQVCVNSTIKTMINLPDISEIYRNIPQTHSIIINHWIKVKECHGFDFFHHLKDRYHSDTKKPRFSLNINTFTYRQFRNEEYSYYEAFKKFIAEIERLSCFSQDEYQTDKTFLASFGKRLRVIHGNFRLNQKM